MDINYKDIGRRIRNERINRNLTQEKLAEMIGISVTHMSNIENANTKLSLPVFIAVANALDCDADILLSGSLSNNRRSASLIISDLLDGCTKEENRVIIDVVQKLKRSLGENIRKD